MRYEDIHITPINHTILGEVKSFGVHDGLGTIMVLKNSEIVLINGVINFESEMSEEVLKKCKQIIKDMSK